jgi:hypothetical protein
LLITSVENTARLAQYKNIIIASVCHHPCEQGKIE